jgi:hypothetical protein
MKTKLYLSFGAFAAIAAASVLTNQASRLAVAEQPVEQPATIDQPVTTPTTETTEYGVDQTATDQKKHHDACKASELIGMNVRGRSGDDDIGEINDLMISKDGRVIYAAVSFGGFLGLGDKLFAVPLDAIEFVKTDDQNYARMDVSEETLKNMEGFNQDNWPQQANSKFRGQLGTRHAERIDTDVDVE